jgi:hypothetical protein
MAKAKRHRVSFTATKKVKQPTAVKFTTKSGEKVKFKAEKPVKKRVKVSFLAK